MMLQVVNQGPPIPDPVIVNIPPGAAPPWETLPPAVFLLIVVAVVAGAVLILGPLVRAFARRIEGGTAHRLQADVTELRARLDAMDQHALQSGEIDASYQRMYELEERVEFVERLISRGGEGGDASRS